MLNEKDRKKLAFLNNMVLEQDKDISRDEVKWLLGRLRATLYRPDEFNFPEYAGLINEKEQAAIALRRHMKPNWIESLDLTGAATASSCEFSITAECPTHDAFLLVRPWIRPHPKTSDEAFEKLRFCSISLVVDDEKLLVDSPIDDYLIAQDGGGLRIPPLLSSPSHKVYPAVELDMGSLNADPTKPLGVFLPNGTVARLSVKIPAAYDGWDVDAVAGFTVMQYTSRPKSMDSEVEIPKGSVKTGPFVKV